MSGVRNERADPAHTCQPGKRSSRDIAQVTRLAVMKMTSPQAKIEKVTNARKILPTTLPSTCVTTSATGVLDAVSAGML